MRRDIHLRQLTDALKVSLAKCAVDPDVEAVHVTRTGTRRIEAALDAKLGPKPGHGAALQGDEDLAKAVDAWQRLLKRVRRAAAPVRDLDVQRKLLRGLAAELGKKSRQDGHNDAFAAQVAKLDGAMKAEREQHAAPLKRNAAKWAAKLDGHLDAFAAAMAQRLALHRNRGNAAATALDAFARLDYQMQQLDAGNLHDFRKGVKKARYMAEAGGEDEYAGVVGKALKRLQDEIGDWHDWLMLDEEAHKYLDANGARLTAEIERLRDEHFREAMRVSEKMRGRLIGERLAVQGARRTGANASRKASSSLKKE
jgi:CHAD domain-containing protein